MRSSGEIGAFVTRCRFLLLLCLFTLWALSVVYRLTQMIWKGGCWLCVKATSTISSTELNVIMTICSLCRGWQLKVLIHRHTRITYIYSEYISEISLVYRPSTISKTKQIKCYIAMWIWEHIYLFFFWDSWLLHDSNWSQELCGSPHLISRPINCTNTISFPRVQPSKLKKT